MLLSAIINLNVERTLQLDLWLTDIAVGYYGFEIQIFVDICILLYFFKFHMTVASRCVADIVLW